MKVLNTILLASFMAVITLVALPLALVQFFYEWASYKVKK